jgi:hypothetical protein
MKLNNLNLILFTWTFPLTIIINNDFIQVAHKVTTCLKATMLLKETVIQMQLLLINVEKIAKGMKTANSGLCIQTLAIIKMKWHWKKDHNRIMHFQEPINVQVLGTFHNKPSSHS